MHQDEGELTYEECMIIGQSRPLDSSRHVSECSNCSDMPKLCMEDRLAEQLG